MTVVVCNNIQCDREVAPSRQGPRRLYCSRSCRWACSAEPELRRVTDGKLTKFGEPLTDRGFHVRFTKSDDRRVRQAARGAGVSVVDFIRDATRRALDGADV